MYICNHIGPCNHPPYYPYPPTWWWSHPYCWQCCGPCRGIHYDPCRDERLREEGRREERVKQRQRPLPYVDVTPALPFKGCR